MHESEWSTVVVLISTGIVSIIGAIFAGLASLRSKQARDSVDTKNELSVGQLEEAQETRRILKKIAEGQDISTREQRHTDQAAERSTGA